MAKRKVDKERKFAIMRAAMLMGYRRMTKSTGWAKPLGFTVLTICPDRGLLEQWFWSGDAKNSLALWNSKKIAKTPSPLDQIKNYEAHGIRTNVGNEQGCDADPITLHLEFCSPEEDVALFLQEKKELM